MYYRSVKERYNQKEVTMYKNLRDVMSAKRITIDCIAKTLSVHRNTIQKKLDGESEFTYDQAVLIEETFFPEYKPSFLFQRIEKWKPPPQEKEERES